MKIVTALILYISCALFISSCSDSKTKAQPEEQKEKGTEKQTISIITEKHVKIPNSSLYIIPPAGFTADELTGTLAQTTGTAHFMQMQIITGHKPGSLFATMKTEADKNFPGSWKEEAITIGEHTATIYHSKTAAYSQYYLAFTDGYTDQMLIANFEDSEAATGKEMYEAMKTVVVKK
ncbi:MAG: hypothetical protein WBC81_08605 [Chitinophagaceae bacterium]